ncbi:MAG TPA: asparagine synthase (glutamine-hydrolyzing) [Gaiellaceae bacterium]|nr:asparagine synthase (glutamine-hydrolyzing) [Gaiellaceae bacterium]
MCGICGVVQLDGPPRDPIAPAALDRMTDLLVHRGPDDRGTYLAPGIALGVRRLAIVDPVHGRQPVASEDGSVVAVQNGELYNHLDLRRQLPGHRFASRCDTEVLPHLYEACGPGFPARLRGKFGLAVWDGHRRRAVIARDRLGVKPLYYAVAGGLLVFASELKSVLAAGLVPVGLDHEAIDAYLPLGYVPAPATPLAAVRKLAPGELLVAGAGTLRRERYWRYPEPEPERPARPAAEYAAELLELLDEAVRLRLMSDVPLGAMLSGGLDSSLIAALMARRAGTPVKTFSVGFREAGRANELADARLVAARLGCEHHELELSYADEAVDLAELAWALDEPLASLSALGFLALSRLAARHVTVALSGQGADELFGGYRKHQAAALAGLVPRPLRPLARLAPGRAARTVAARGPVERLLAMSGKLDAGLRRDLLRGPLERTEGAARRAIERVARGAGDDPLTSTLFLDAQLALVDDMLHYFDRTSMAHSLEVRVPFLDHELVEWAARLPARLKVRGLGTKVLLKQAARGLVPDEIVDKPKIGFFRGASDGWLRSQLSGALSDYLLGPDLRCSGFLDRGGVERLVRRQRAGDGRDTHLLLAILMLEVWLSTYLPRALAVPEPQPDRLRIPAPAPAEG